MKWLALVALAMACTGCSHKGVGCGIAHVPVQVHVWNEETNAPVSGAIVDGLKPRIQHTSDQRAYIEAKLRASSGLVMTDANGWAEGTSMAGYGHYIGGYPHKADYTLGGKITIMKDGYESQTIPVSDQHYIVRHSLFSHPGPPTLERTIFLTPVEAGTTSP